MNGNLTLERLHTLYSKGGIMFFTVEKQDTVYSGMVLLSPVEDNFRRRAVYVKQYRCNDNVT